MNCLLLFTDASHCSTLLQVWKWIPEHLEKCIENVNPVYVETFWPLWHEVFIPQGMDEQIVSQGIGPRKWTNSCSALLSLLFLTLVLVTFLFLLTQLGPQTTQLPMFEYIYQLSLIHIVSAPAVYLLPPSLPLCHTEDIVSTRPPLSLSLLLLLRLRLPLIPIINLNFHCCCIIPWIGIIIQILLLKVISISWTRQSDDCSPLLLSHLGPLFPAPSPHVQLRDLHFRAATLKLLEAKASEKHQNNLIWILAHLTFKEVKQTWNMMTWVGKVWK